MKESSFEFFMNYERAALQIFFLLCKDVLWWLTLKQTGFWVWSYGSVSRETHFSSSFPGPLVVRGLPVSCSFDFPSGGLGQRLSRVGVFVCCRNIDAGG